MELLKIMQISRCSLRDMLLDQIVDNYLVSLREKTTLFLFTIYLTGKEYFGNFLIDGNRKCFMMN